MDCPFQDSRVAARCPGHMLIFPASFHEQTSRKLCVQVAWLQVFLMVVSFGKDMTETHYLYRWELIEKLTSETQNTFLGW